MEKSDATRVKTRTHPQGVRAEVRRVTAATIIYEYLHQEIASMALLPGAPLQEGVLTQRFGVSRTPVREALIQLSKDGLVDLFPQSGTFVARIPSATIIEAAVIRSALEVVIVQRAAEVTGDAEIQRLDAVLRHQRHFQQARETDGFHEADEAFHEELARISGYPLARQVIKQFKVQIDRSRRLTLPIEGRMLQVISEHKRIRDAVAANDREQAAARMVEHLNVVIPDLALLQRDYPDYFS